MDTKRLARLCVENGLLVACCSERSFPGRNGGTASDYIIDVRGAASNLPLRGILLGALGDGLSNFSQSAVVGGVSRGGLVFGSMLALVVSRGFVAVLPDGPRASGLCRAVEGVVLGRKVVLFDNIVGSGRSLLDAAGHVAAAGGAVVGAMVVGCYGVVPALPFPVISLLNLADLVDAAREAGRNEPSAE